MLHTDVLLCTTRSLRLRKEVCEPLGRSVQESNGAEAFRVFDSRDAPDTQSRQYVLMQKIMMPVTSWRQWCQTPRRWTGCWNSQMGA